MLGGVVLMARGLCVFRSSDRTEAGWKIASWH